MANNENCGCLDQRPSRLDIGALLSALAVRTRLTVIDALEAGGLLSGCEAQPGIVPDASGRISNRQLDLVLLDFDEPTPRQVTSVLSQVDASAL
jgi:hypothetical protein